MIRKLFFIFSWSICLASYIPGNGHYSGGSSIWGYFTPPLVHRVPSESHKTAMEAMVDLTNNLAVAILQDHSYSRGNFAFSPYGVASVLVVLYEGARGESARQIHTSVGFPPDKDIVRVGFRDIHRHLRNYFSHEGYLSGISLNKDSSSLKPEYKKILRFYGYDVDVGHSSEEENISVGSAITMPTKTTVLTPDTTTTVATTTNNQTEENNMKSTTEESNSTTTQLTTTESVSSDTNTEEAKQTTTIASTITPDSSQETTTNDSSEENTTSSVESITTSVKSTTSQQIEETTTQQNENTTTQQNENTTTQQNEDTTTQQNENTTTQQSENTTILTTTECQDEKTTTESKNKEDEVEINLTIDDYPTLEDFYTKRGEKNKINETTAERNGTDTDTTEKKKTDKTNEIEINSTEENMRKVSEKTSEIPESSTTENSYTEKSMIPESGTQTSVMEENKKDFDNGMLIPQIGDKVTTTAETEGTSTTTTATESNIQTVHPNKVQKPARNVKNLYETESNIKTLNNIKMSRSNNEVNAVSERLMEMFNSRSPLWLDVSKKKHNSRIKRTLTDYLKSPYSTDLSLQLQNGMYDTHVSRNAEMYRSLPRLLFLVDGAVDTPVPMMTYTNVFPYAYIPRLHAKALEFPLDDVRYKLVILLPVERRGLKQLIYDLNNFSLDKVLSVMRPTRVKAMVPTFMVEGFVILTSSLQKLGIWDVFDPRKANLSGMSLDPELYVRNVEQSVTVVIRNYVEILDIQTRTMAARQMEYEFEATHPFLYFVLDTATNVALMAGQILDPLNSRIY